MGASIKNDNRSASKETLRAFVFAFPELIEKAKALKLDIELPTYEEGSIIPSLLEAISHKDKVIEQLRRALLEKKN